MLININYHIWFRVCRSVKYKYKLTTNDLLVLNGCYMLYRMINKPFTENKIYSFVTYYNKPKLKAYIKRLIELKFIVCSGDYNTHLLYCISEQGMKVIEDLNNSYEVELLKFCNQYSISL